MGSPRSVYSALNAYKYFSRYAKNHGYSVDIIISDVSMIYAKKHPELK